MTSCRSRIGRLAVMWHKSKSPEAYAPSVKISMAEPPTTTSSTPRSAQSALHSEAIFRLLMVGSGSAVTSASADVIFSESTVLMPHRNILLLQKLFHIAHGVGADMEKTRGEKGVGRASQQPFRHVFQAARAAAGHHRNAHGFAHAAGDDEIKPGFCAVGVNGVQPDLARAERH